MSVYRLDSRKKPIVGIHRETNSIVPITKVTEKRLNCNCNCYVCKNPLIAVLETEKRIHFKHHTKSNCRPSPETELHLLAKYFILNNNQIFLPGEGLISYSNPVAELRLDDLIPDAAIECNGRKIFIEIIVTNPIDHIKYLKYKDKNSTVLTIDLSEEDRDLDEDDLKCIVLEEEANKKLLLYHFQPNEASSINESSFTFSKWLVPFGLLAIAGLYVFKKLCPRLFNNTKFQKKTRSYSKSNKYCNRPV